MALSMGKIAKGLGVTLLRAANSGSIPLLDTAMNASGAKGIGDVLRDNSAKSKAIKGNAEVTTKLINAITAEKIKLANIEAHFSQRLLAATTGYASIPPTELTTSQVFKARGYITKVIDPLAASMKFNRIKPQSASHTRLDTILNKLYKEMNELQNEYDKSHRVLLSLKAKQRALNNTLISLQRRP